MSERLELDPDERRVIGVLIEKSLTTPQAYPLTINAIVTGSNQKSNRDPILELVDDQVEEVLQNLRGRSLTAAFYPAGSRSEKWRQELTLVLELDGQEKAVVAELLLRGPQTLGELRTRASRMKQIPDQAALHQVIDRLASRSQPLVVRLSPQGQTRGVRVTHGLYPEAELEEIRDAEATGVPSSRPATLASSSVNHELEALRQRVAAIEAHLGISPPTESLH